MAGDAGKYDIAVKTDSTPLAAVVWARSVACLGPETWTPTSKQRLSDARISTLLYNTTKRIQREAVTVQRGWAISVVLLFNPLLLFVSLVGKVISYARSPIGSGFGVVSMLASIGKDECWVLRGAGLSGQS